MRRLFFSICIWVLIASGAFLTVRGALEYWQSRSAQHQFAREWAHDDTSESKDPLLSGTADRPVKTGGVERHSQPVSRHGDAIAKLTIPRLNTVLYVVEGTDDRDLKRGPGHLTGTALPGGDGNCVIAGHRDTHFRVLKNIQDGDEVIVERSGRQYRYRVEEMSIVSPDDTRSLRPTGKPVLNLITCYPFEYIGSAPKRLVIRADRENSPLITSASPTR